MDAERFAAWLDAYFAAWISNDATDVAALFTEDATYSVGPFAEAWSGRDEIVRRWTSGPREDVAFSYDVLSSSEDAGIAHWNLRSRRVEGGAVEMDGILLITFADDGRCRDHREWYAKRELPAG